MISNSAGGADSRLPRPFPVFVLNGGARCGPQHDDILYPERPSAAASAKALELCKPCPLRPDCLAYALEHEPFYGNYAGYTPHMRRAMQRRTITPEKIKENA